MRRFPRVSGRGFHLSYDTHELSFPRRSKRTVNGVVAAIREDPRIRFVAFKDPEKPEPTTMPILGREGVFESTPHVDWGKVTYIGAGVIDFSESYLPVTWGNQECERRFGHSHPANPAEHARAEQQVVDDFSPFLAMI